MTEIEQIVFVDTETGGLRPDDPIWEVATLRLDGAIWHHKVWHLPVDVGLMSQWTLDNTGFADRYDLHNLTPVPEFLEEFKKEFWDGTETQRHIAGNVISFDTLRIEKLYNADGGRFPPWHYHIIDVEAMIVGYLAAKGISWSLPWKSEALSELIGVPVPPGTHNALVDAVWSRDMLLTVLSGQS